MMFYRRKKTKGFSYYLKALIYVIIAVCAVCSLYQERIITETGFNADKILAQSVLKNKTFTAEIKEINEDGLSAYLMEEHSNPIVSVDFEFDNSGYAHDKKYKFGLAKIAADLITAGAGKYSAQTLLDLLAENGIKINFGVSKDVFYGSMITPKENLKTAQFLLKQIIQEPRLQENHLRVTKAQLIKSLQLQNEKPEGVLVQAYNKQLFGTHPYARNPIGRKEDIYDIKSDDVRNYLKNSFAKQNLTIGISGDIGEKESKLFLKDVFGALPETSRQSSLSKFEYEPKGEEFNVEREIPQVIALFSANGTYRESKDFYPLYLANYIFGESGLTSRLNKVLREDNGLTYGVFTYLSNNDTSALIEGKFSASAENYENAKSLLLDQWRKMAEEGVSKNELEKAKKSLIDSFNLRFADIDGVSKMLVAMQKYNLGSDFLQKRNDYIRNVTLKEVNNAAAKYYGVEPDFVTIGIERKK